MIRTFIEANGIKQTEIASELDVDKAQVNRWMDPDANLTRKTVDALLAFFSKRLGRPASYEEAILGEPMPIAAGE